MHRRQISSGFRAAVHNAGHVSPICEYGLCGDRRHLRPHAAWIAKGQQRANCRSKRACDHARAHLDARPTDDRVVLTSASAPTGQLDLCLFPSLSRRCGREYVWGWKRLPLRVGYPLNPYPPFDDFRLHPGRSQVDRVRRQVRVQAVARRAEIA